MTAHPSKPPELFCAECGSENLVDRSAEGIGWTECAECGSTKVDER